MKSKINIMKAMPPISEEEIKSYMNFDEVMHQRHLQVSRSFRLKRIFTLATGAAVIGVVGYLMIPDQSPSVVTANEPAQQTIKADSGVLKAEQEVKSDIKPAESQPENQIKPSVSKIDRNEPAVEKVESTSPAVDYHEAEPIEGYPHLYEYFSRELRYPPAAIKDSIRGTVSVSFVINKDGKPEQIIIQNSLGTLFDQESIRLIKEMPAWRPASLNGKSLPAKLSVPLTFTILTTNVPDK